MLGGFLIGPFTPGPTLSEVHQFEVLAELGVILLMYSIGLESSFDELLQVKWVAIFGGQLGILFSVALAWPRDGCWAGIPLRAWPWARLFRWPAPWCFPGSWRIAENCGRLTGRCLGGMIVILTMLGKFAVWTAVVWLFRYPPRTALMVGLGLTQIGEFSYVLARVARDSHLVTDDVYHATLAASVITILLNGLLMKALPKTAAPAG